MRERGPTRHWCDVALRLVAALVVFGFGVEHASAQRRGSILPRAEIGQCFDEHEVGRGAHSVTVAVTVRANENGTLDLLALSLRGARTTVDQLAPCVEPLIAGVVSTLRAGTMRSERWSVRLAADPELAAARRAARGPSGREGDVCAWGTRDGLQGGQADPPPCRRGLSCCYPCGIDGCPRVCMASCGGPRP